MAAAGGLAAGGLAAGELAAGYVTRGSRGGAGPEPCTPLHRVAERSHATPWAACEERSSSKAQKG
jgi:hypothetical protein